MNRFVRSRYPDKVDPTGEPVLTPRQREVWRRLANGESAKEIAAGLNVSIGTVNGHREALFLRLGVKNAIPAVRLAIRWAVVAEPVLANAHVLEIARRMALEVHRPHDPRFRPLLAKFARILRAGALSLPLVGEKTLRPPPEPVEA